MPLLCCRRDAAIPGHHRRSSVPVVRCRPRPLSNQHDRQQQEHQQHYHCCLAPVLGQDFGECAGQRGQRGQRRRSQRCQSQWWQSDWAGSGLY